MVFVDLHIHTTASDGELKPIKVVEEAYKLGLRIISITDHDCVDGLLELGQDFGALNYGDINVIAEIEISAKYKKVRQRKNKEQTVHILVYNIQYKNKNFLEKIILLKERRVERSKEIIERLNMHGINITLDEVLKHAKGSVGRPYIARALVKKGYANNENDVFKRYIGKGRPCYVPSKKIWLDEALELIYSMHGIPVLAHPKFIGNKNEIECILRAYNFKGLEAYYPSHSKEKIEEFKLLAHKLNCIVTGGSDFHGYEIHGRHSKLGKIKQGKKGKLDYLSNEEVSNFLQLINQNA